MSKQKAAMLLMSLDNNTATQLLKGLPANDIQEIGVELAKLDASGFRDSPEQITATREFYNKIAKGRQKMNFKGFLGEMLVSLLGKEKAKEIQLRIKEVTGKQDPFIEIRSATTDELVLALEGEHQQTIAVVLSELPAKKSREIMLHLGEESRLKAVCKMTTVEQLGVEVKHRIAKIMTEKLNAYKGETLPVERKQTLRKLAIVLSGLKKDLRNRMLEEISGQDEETATMVKALMVTWDNIPSIADRSLQDMLKDVDEGKLAVALHEADATIVEKIKSNISECAAASVDEEISLMQEPMEEEIIEAREAIVEPLRQANEEGKLRMAKRQ